MTKVLNEPIIAEDNYPINPDYLYVADGVVIRNNGDATTAKKLKESLGIKELRRCDITGRDLWDYAV